MPQTKLVGGPRGSALTDERFLRPHYAKLVSLGVGENGPGLSASLPDVNPACPERKKTVDLLETVCRVAGQVEVHTVLDRLGIGDRHEADADERVLVSPNNDLPLALGEDLPAKRLRPEPGQAGQVVSVDDDVVKSDRHADSLQDTLETSPADPHSSRQPLPGALRRCGSARWRLPWTRSLPRSPSPRPRAPGTCWNASAAGVWQCVAPAVSARSSARRSEGGPLVVEDGHQHLVVPAPVVQHRLAEAALLDEPRLLVGADPSGVERSHTELNAVQAHLAESVADDDAHRIRAVATADVLTAEGDPERRTPVLGARAPQPNVADQHRRIFERLDGEAEVVLLVCAPLRDPLLRGGLRWRRHPVR